MMKGWLVVNSFVESEKFNVLFDMLEKAAKAQGAELERRGNAELWTWLFKCGYELGTKRPDFVIFWDKDIKLAQELERQGLRVFNSARAIAECDDKSLTYLRLQHAGILQPETLVSPKKFHADGKLDESFLKASGELLGYPCIIKECMGSFGQQVRLAENEEQLRSFILDCGDRPYIIQRYIAASKGRDIRVQVVGDKVVAGMLRENPDDFRANITNGGTMRDCTAEITHDQRTLAIRATRALGLDFAGVDILFGEHGESILCEVNSNAHFKNLFDCSGIDTAGFILQHILKSVS